MNLQSIMRSAGLIDDVLVRPFNRFSQRVVNNRGRNFLPNFSGRNVVQNQVGSGTPIIRPPASINSPAYTQGGAQRFAAEYGTGARNVPAAAANAAKPGWQGNVLGAATTAVGLLGDPFGISEALLGTAGKPNQSRMSLLGGVNTDPLIPTTTPMQRAQVGQPMVLNGRLGYKSADGTWQTRGDMESEDVPQYLPGSPQADTRGYVWDAQRSQAAPPAGKPPAVVSRLSPEEQAYNQERSRIAQLTAQNPEFQNIGQLRNDLRDQGMAIWQQQYGNTPMGQPGGAVGAFNPLMQQTFGYQTGMSPAQMAEMQKTAAPVQVAPGEVPYQQGDLGTRATLETGYDPAALGLTPEKIEAMKKQLLQQASK